jgi:tRNA(adenine34) deaminase
MSAPSLFAKNAETIARVMANKKVNPKGIGSDIRIVQYFINRAGNGLSVRRRHELEKAERLLQEGAKKAKP